jgi:arsenical pump membrane protein
MDELQAIFTVAVFALAVLFLLWRPGGIHESVPTSVGAAVLLAAGIVGMSDLVRVAHTVGGAAATILSTVVMSIILDTIGYFRWVAHNLIAYARGSGIRLYWLTVSLCFLMTLFFNNDGSVLITTPIILRICAMLRLDPAQQIPYLLSGALIATAASAPIGVSNLANLVALRIVGLDVNRYAELMLVPSMAGIATIAALLFVRFRRAIPRRIPVFATGKAPVPRAYYPKRAIRRWTARGPSSPDASPHPPTERHDEATCADPRRGERAAAAEPHDAEEPVDWPLFRISLAIVVLTRASFFAAERIGVPMEAIAWIGTALLLAVRRLRTGIGVGDVVGRTPWHILLFAFSVYVLVTALDRAGFTALVASALEPFMMMGDGYGILASGLLLTVMSVVMNNLPSIMIGTLALTEMGLPEQTLQLAYLAGILGSDIGALLTPTGTLASLIWMYLLRKADIPMTWGTYLGAAWRVVPIGLGVALLGLYAWTRWVL